MRKRKDVFARNLHRHASARKAMKAVNDHAENRTDSPLAIGHAGQRIDKMVNEPLIAERMRHLLEEERSEAIAEAAEEKEVTLYGVVRMRAILARMLDGDWKVKKHVRLGNVLVETHEELTPTELFRAMDMNMKMANMMLKMQGLDDMLADLRITVPGRSLASAAPELDPPEPMDGADPYRYNEEQRYQHVDDKLEEERPIPESLPVKQQKATSTPKSQPPAPHPSKTPIATILQASAHQYPPTIPEAIAPQSTRPHTQDDTDDAEGYAAWGPNLPSYDAEVGRRTRERGGFMPIADKIRLHENQAIEQKLRRGNGEIDDLDDYLQSTVQEKL